MARPKSGAASSEPAKSPFIFVTATTAKLDPATRKRVRSHVMRGKNRKPQKTHGEGAIGSWINGRQQAGPNSRTLGRWAVPPLIVGNDLATFSFADDMKPYMLDLLFSWFTVLKNAMYPIEAIVQPSDALWLQHLASDRALLHAVLCSAQAFLDFVREARFGDKAMYHLTRAIRTLRENLAYVPTVSDTTIGTVLILTLLSDSVGETAVARQHMQGLYELVKLRGGIKALRHNGDLQTKALRADLGFAINAGTKPLFFAEGFSWDPYLVPHSDGNINNKDPNLNKRDTEAPIQPNPASLLRYSLLCPGVRDVRVLNTLLDLQEFARAANLAFQTGRKIATDLFRETLVSVQYRLLALRDEGDDEDVATVLQSGFGTSPVARDEPGSNTDAVVDTAAETEAATARAASLLLRLGMLAFTTTTFLYIKEIPVRDTDLARRARTCLRSLRSLTASHLFLPASGPLPPRAHHQIHNNDNNNNHSQQQGNRRMMKDIITPCQRQLCRLALWFVFVTRVSVLRRGAAPAESGGNGNADRNVDEEELLVSVAARLVEILGLRGWAEVREVLYEYMWIDWLHAGEGKDLWEKVEAAVSAKIADGAGVVGSWGGSGTRELEGC